jgi:hypothetical protein
MTGITMVAPAGSGGIVEGSNQYTVNSDGTINGVAATDVVPLLRAGWRFVSVFTTKAVFAAPNTASLVNVKAAATPANGTITIAAQPDVPRKLQVRVVIGTTTTTAITAGTLTLVGVDQDGNAISEVLSLIANASVTLKTKWAYAKLTSGTVASYAAAGSGTGNTLGLGNANDLGIPTGQNVIDFTCFKETAFTIGTSGADETVGTVDPVARTVAPTTAPTTDTTAYEFSCSYTLPA